LKEKDDGEQCYCLQLYAATPGMGKWHSRIQSSISVDESQATSGSIPLSLQLSDIIESKDLMKIQLIPIEGIIRNGVGLIQISFAVMVNSCKYLLGS
jgi:hypothetical protein